MMNCSSYLGRQYQQMKMHGHRLWVYQLNLVAKILLQMCHEVIESDYRKINIDDDFSPVESCQQKKKKRCHKIRVRKWHRENQKFGMPQLYEKL